MSLNEYVDGYFARDAGILRDVLDVGNHLGDLRCRRSEKSSYNAAFWDREEFSFEAVEIPAGLTLDERTGAISGTLDKAGVYEVRYEVSDQQGTKRTMGYRLVVK